MYILPHMLINQGICNAVFFFIGCQFVVVAFINKRNFSNVFAGSTDSAKSVAFDNTDTGLEADNVQEAIEEVKNYFSVLYQVIL